MDELLARLRAALRRAAPAEEEAVVETADFTVDLAAKRVTDAAGGEVRADADRVAIVEVLVRNAGKLVSQRQLLQEVWGPQYETRDELPARLPGPDPPQARARSRKAPLLHHRAADGLPVRASFVQGAGFEQPPELGDLRGRADQTSVSPS